MTIERLESRRLMDAGDLDPTFGGGGSITRIAGANLRTETPDINIGPNNEIVMAAVVVEPPNTPSGRAFATVWRTFADGSNDYQFGRSLDEQGQVTIPLPDDVSVVNDFFSPPDVHAAVGPDGSVFVHAGYRIFKLRSDGKLDRAFAHRGRAAFMEFDPNPDMSVEVDAQGRIYVLGTRQRFDDVNLAKLYRLNPDGSLDTTFADGGVFVPPIDLDALKVEVKVLRDDHVMLAGNQDNTFFAIRLNSADGSLDPTYGTGGVASQFLPSGDLDITRVHLRNITEDGFAIFDQGHQTPGFDFNDLAGFDPSGAQMSFVVTDQPAIVGFGEFHRDDALFVAPAGSGPRFFDQEGHLLEAPTAHAADSLELAPEDESVESITLARDGSMLICTMVPDNTQAAVVGNGFRLRRMFRDDAPIAQYIPRVDSTRLNEHSFLIDIRWLNHDGIDPATLGDDDITVGFPVYHGRRAGARFVAHGVGAGGAFTRYALIAPDGRWDEGENGVYTIRVERRSVRDLDGNSAAQRTIGTFAVQL